MLPITTRGRSRSKGPRRQVTEPLPAGVGQGEVVTSREAGGGQGTSVGLLVAAMISLGVSEAPLMRPQGWCFLAVCVALPLCLSFPICEMGVTAVFSQRAVGELPKGPGQSRCAADATVGGGVIQGATQTRTEYLVWGTGSEEEG